MTKKELLNYEMKSLVKTMKKYLKELDTGEVMRPLISCWMLICILYW